MASMSKTAPVPMGVSDDGTPYFTEGDLIYGKSVSISRIPFVNVLLHVFPSNTSVAQYKGNTMPIKCYINANGEHGYRCLHVQIEEDEDKGEPHVICTVAFVATSGVTNGTLRSHCHVYHWIKSGVKVTQVAMCGFFVKLPAQKKLKTASGKTYKVSVMPAAPIEIASHWSC